MLYIAFFKAKPGVSTRGDFTEKNRRWWNEGERPKGLRTVAMYGALGTETPDVYVFEAERAQDIHKLIAHWREVDFDIHPAVDLIEVYRQQGMSVE
jgi:hypothetical protein